MKRSVISGEDFKQERGVQGTFSDGIKVSYLYNRLKNSYGILNKTQDLDYESNDNCSIQNAIFSIMKNTTDILRMYFNSGNSDTETGFRLFSSIRFLDYRLLESIGDVILAVCSPRDKSFNLDIYFDYQYFEKMLWFITNLYTNEINLDIDIKVLIEEIISTRKTKILQENLPMGKEFQWEILKSIR